MPALAQNRFMAYATLEEANTYLNIKFPTLPNLTEPDLEAASLEVDEEAVSGRISSTTGLKINTDDLDAHQKTCLIRATVHQAAFRREMALDSDRNQIIDELEVVRGADGSERKRAHLKFSPQALYWLFEAEIPQVEARLGSSRKEIGFVEIGG